jgi:enoyl-[acyl-carrier-protein] reductase (NADH)
VLSDFRIDHGAALFLAGSLSTAIAGEVLFVDCGHNIMGF